MVPAGEMQELTLGKVSREAGATASLATGATPKHLVVVKNRMQRPWHRLLFVRSHQVALVRLLYYDFLFCGREWLLRCSTRRIGVFDPLVDDGALIACFTRKNHDNIYIFLVFRVHV